MMTNRLLAIALVAITLVWMACTPGHAQQPAPLTEADITRSTECGAGGVGRIWAGDRREQIERRDPAPGERVNDDGYWSVGCQPPAPPAQPAACPGAMERATWTVNGNVCEANGRIGGGAFDTGGIPGMRSGMSAKRTQWAGAMRGTITYACQNGQRSVLSATCAPATQCDTSVNLTRDGVTFGYNGAAKPAALGAYVVATPDKPVTGSPTLRLQCVAGEWQESPPCTARQELPREVYVFNNQALQPGQVGTATRVRGAGTKWADGQPPDTIRVTCRADGSVAAK